MIISADDYGISPGVSRSIRDLAAKKRISATSCMVNSEEALNELDSLKAYRDQLDVGLHIDLSEGESALFNGFRSLAIAAHLKRIEKNEIKKVIRNQIERFIDGFGQAPTHLDGHHHAHQLPIVRDALVEVYMEMKLKSYVRIFSIPKPWLFGPRICFENMVIQLQSQGLTRKLDKKNIPRNRYLLGHYSYDKPLPFSIILKNYLRLNPSAEDIFICHPGYQETTYPEDSISLARQDCASYLLSDEFEKLGVNINRFKF